MLLKAIKNENGYIGQAENGELIAEGYIYKTKKEVYEACEQIYPNNSTWQGKKVKSGYYINVDL